MFPSRHSCVGNSMSLNLKSGGRIAQIIVRQSSEKSSFFSSIFQRKSKRRQAEEEEQKLNEELEKSEKNFLKEIEQVWVVS